MSEPLILLAEDDPEIQVALERILTYEGYRTTTAGYDFESSSRSLDVHVGYLRRKLEDGGHDRLIETVRGVGL